MEPGQTVMLNAKECLDAQRQMICPNSSNFDIISKLVNQIKYQIPALALLIFALSWVWIHFIGNYSPHRNCRTHSHVIHCSMMTFPEGSNSLVLPYWCIITVWYDSLIAYICIIMEFSHHASRRKPALFTTHVFSYRELVLEATNGLEILGCCITSFLFVRSS